MNKNSIAWRPECLIPPSGIHYDIPHLAPPNWNLTRSPHPLHNCMGCGFLV